MKNSFKLLIGIIPLVGFLLCPVVDAQGAECLDDSPTIQAGKDPYGLIAVRELTKDESETLKRLLKSLEGEWQGHAQDIYCRGIKDPGDKDVNQYSAKADVEVDHYGNFSIRVSLYHLEKRVTHAQRLRFYLTQNKLRVNKASAYGDVELTSVSSTSIALLFRRLRTYPNSKGTTRKEHFIFLDLDGARLTIRQLVYSQGRLSYQERWDLAR